MSKLEGADWCGIVVGGMVVDAFRDILACTSASAI